MSSLHEECGLFGIFANEICDVAHTAYYGLFASASQAVSDWPCRTACKAAAVACNCCQSGVFGSFMAMTWG